jgi:SAM-dependent methyltransferase
MENMSEAPKRIENRTPMVSNWVRKYISLIPSRKIVLDLACGSGCNTRFLLDQGYTVAALDKDVSQLADISGKPNLKIYEFDLETNADFPFNKEELAGIIVTNYLYRPLFTDLIDALSHGGVLIYQTFMAGNEAYGRPSNPNFLLKINELNDVFANKLDVVAFEQGYEKNPKPSVIQKICAVNRCF